MRYIEEFRDVRLENERLTFDVKLKPGVIRGSRGRMDLRYLAEDAKLALRDQLLAQGLPLGDLQGWEPPEGGTPP